MTDDDEHPYNFGALPPLPAGFSVFYNDNIEHYYATGPDEWQSVITVDPYQARKWCFVEAFKRARAAQREGGMNSWPGGVRKAMTQDQHERWNALNYPGTRQLCSECESETGRCEEDAIYVGDRGPLCDECEGGRDV